jgi:uncharacterized protein YigA (DUF484 family)
VAQLGFLADMRAPTLKEHLARKQDAEAELTALANKRERLKTEAARLKLIPDAVRITGAIVALEKQIAKRSKRK